MSKLSPPLVLACPQVRTCHVQRCMAQHVLWLPSARMRPVRARLWRSMQWRRWGACSSSKPVPLFLARLRRVQAWSEARPRRARPTPIKDTTPTTAPRHSPEGRCETAVGGRGGRRSRGRSRSYGKFEHPARGLHTSREPMAKHRTFPCLGAGTREVHRLGAMGLLGALERQWPSDTCCAREGFSSGTFGGHAPELRFAPLVARPHGSSRCRALVVVVAAIQTAACSCCPPCTFWCKMGRWGAVRTEQEWRRLREEALHHLSLAARVMQWQHSRGRTGSLEQPSGCISWSLTPVEDLLELEGWRKFTWPSCRYEHRDPGSGRLFLKRQGVVANIDLAHMCVPCTCPRGSHQCVHGVVKGGPRHGEKRSVISGEYPMPMCRAMAEAVRQRWRPMG